MKTKIIEELCSDLEENEIPVAGIGSGKAYTIQLAKKMAEAEKGKRDNNGR